MNKCQIQRLIALCLCCYSGMELLGAADDIQFSALRMSSSLAQGRESVQLEGNARLESDEFEIIADRIVLQGQSYQEISCMGSIQVTDKKNASIIKSDRLFYRRATGYLRASGSVELRDPKEGVMARADYLERLRTDAPIFMQAGARFIKEDTFAGAESLQYDDKAKLALLIGDAFVIQDDSEFSADRITINTETMDVRMEGSVSGLVPQEETETQ